MLLAGDYPDAHPRPGTAPPSRAAAGKRRRVVSVSRRAGDIRAPRVPRLSLFSSGERWPVAFSLSHGTRGIRDRSTTRLSRFSSSHLSPFSSRQRRPVVVAFSLGAGDSRPSRYMPFAVFFVPASADRTLPFARDKRHSQPSRHLAWVSDSIRPLSGQKRRTRPARRPHSAVPRERPPPPTIDFCE